MKILASSYYLILLLLVTSLVHAQTYSDVNLPTDLNNAHKKTSQIGLLSPQITNKIGNNSKNNGIYIQQIGNKNNIVSYTRSISSDVNLFQRGNKNDITVNLTAISINENVLQMGYNNKYLNLGSRTRLQSTSVIQKGRNQNLLMLGSNSISEKMVVRMRGKKQTVFIRNLK